MQNKSVEKIISNNYKESHYTDAPIFNFLNPNNNDKLSKMSGFDLQDLIILIDDYYIELRNKLGFKEGVTFGLELEFEDASKKQIEKQLKEAFSDDSWIIKEDCSLHNGAEINSPILTDTEINWKNLNKVCSIVEPLASIGTRSGGHIHIGAQTLKNDKTSWLNFIKMWATYENVIFRFSYGDFLTARYSLLKYAEPVSKKLWKDYEKLKKEKASLNAIISEIASCRYHAVNFCKVSKNNCSNFNVNNTIEFRCPNGSLHAAIWQNNVNLFVKMLCYSNSALFNDDLIEQRYRLNKDKFDELKWYDEIYLEQALELCDMVFSNNLDKIYFLKQYLKYFQVCNDNTNSFPKARTLIKKKYNNFF